MPAKAKKTKAKSKKATKVVETKKVEKVIEPTPEVKATDINASKAETPKDGIVEKVADKTEVDTSVPESELLKDGITEEIVDKTETMVEKKEEEILDPKETEKNSILPKDDDSEDDEPEVVEPIEVVRIKASCEAILNSRKSMSNMPTPEQLRITINAFVNLMYTAKQNSTTEALDALFAFFVEHRDGALAPGAAMIGIKRLPKTTASAVETFYNLIMIGVERKLGLQSTPVSIRAVRLMLPDQIGRAHV